MITDTVCSVGVFAWMRGSFPCPPRHALVSKNRACAEGETHTTYTDTDTHTHTSGLKLGEKDGSARGGGDSASGGNSNTGTREQAKIHGSKSLRHLTHEKCVEISKGVAG